MGLLSKIGGGIVTALNTLSTTIAHPIEVTKAILSPTKKVSEVTQKFVSQPTSQRATQVLSGGAGLAATVVGAGAVSGAVKAGTLLPSAINVAKGLIPTTTKGKVATAIAAPIVVGAVSSKPIETAKAAATLPTELSKFGADVADFAVNPSVETGKELIKESPIISTVAAGAILGTAVTKVAPAIASTIQTQAIKENTQALEEIKTPQPQTITQQPTTYKFIETPAVVPSQPVTPLTEKVNATTQKKKKRRSKVKQIPQNISQRVNVLVQNRNTNIRQTKTYLNKQMLYN